MNIGTTIDWLDILTYSLAIVTLAFIPYENKKCRH